MDVSAALGQAARLEPLIDDIFGISAYDEHAGHKDSRQIFPVDELWPNMRKLADAAVKIDIYPTRPRKWIPGTGIKTGNMRQDRGMLAAAGAKLKLCCRMAPCRVQTEAGVTGKITAWPDIGVSLWKG